MRISPLSKNREKWIRKLRLKKYRDAEGVFMAEGFNAFNAAMEHTLYPVLEIVVERSHAESIRDRVPEDIPLHECSERAMHSISTEESPQGIVMICRRSSSPFGSLFLKTLSPLLFIDRVSDPGNLGTIIRTAAWFGIGQVILSPRCVDPFNTKVIRSSAGTFFGMELFCDCSFESLKRCADENRYRLIATTPHGGTSPRTLESSGRDILLLGQESDGLEKNILSEADCRVSIAGRGHVESLNLSTACAIILYELTHP